MDKILILEDDRASYFEIADKLIETELFEVIPDRNDETAVTEMIKALKSGRQGNGDSVYKYISRIITSNNKDLTVVICDMQIVQKGSDIPQGVDFIRYIRQLMVPESPIYAKYLPIIAYTNYPAKNEDVEAAVELGSVFYVQKNSDESEYIEQNVKYLSDYFRFLQNGYTFDTKLNVLLEKANEIKKQEEWIANAIFLQLENKYRKTLYQKFELETKSMISAEQLNLLDNDFWERAKQYLISFNNKDGATDLVEGFEAILNDFGLAKEGKGKVLMVLIKTITRSGEFLIRQLS